MRVLYHDDFDGVASATLLCARMRDRRPTEPLTFISVDYGHTDLAWSEALPKGLSPGESLAIVDFMFHPAADVYVDHHATAFKTAEHRAFYDAMVGQTRSLDLPYYWNGQAPSCAEALALVMPEMRFRYSELIAAATQIDQAAYASVEDYLEMRTPAIAISHAIPLMTEGEKGELIRRLVIGTLEDGAVFAAQAIAEAQTRIREGVRVTEAATVLLDHVAVTDLVMMDAPWTRFAPYALYPKAKYSFTIYRTGTTVRVSLGKNPWMTFTPVHLGDLANAVGGGGHPYAAGCQFEGDDAYTRAWQFVRRAVNAANAT